MPRAPFQAVPITMLASAARTTSSATANLKNTTGALPISDAVTLILDVTALEGQTLDVYLDSSPDGGTTWFTSIHWPRITTSTGTQAVNFRSTGIGPNEVANSVGIASTSTGTIVANTVVTPDQRIRWIGGTGFTSGTFAVYAFCQPFGTNGQ